MFCLLCLRHSGPRESPFLLTWEGSWQITPPAAPIAVPDRRGTLCGSRDSCLTLGQATPGERVTSKSYGGCADQGSWAGFVLT